MGHAYIIRDNTSFHHQEMAVQLAVASFILCIEDVLGREEGAPILDLDTNRHLPDWVVNNLQVQSTSISIPWFFSEFIHATTKTETSGAETGFIPWPSEASFGAHLIERYIPAKHWVQVCPFLLVGRKKVRPCLPLIADKSGG